MGWTKKGVAFLPNTSKQELKASYKQEEKPKAKMRLLAAIHRKEGKSISDIAFALQKPRMTISDWLQRLENGGLNRLHDTKQSGKPPKLNTKQKKELKKILSSSPEKQNIPFRIWNTSLVQYVIDDLFNIFYKPRNVRYITKKLGFSMQKPRPKHRKANKKLQEEFKKNFKKKFGTTLNVDSRSFVLTKHILPSCHT